MALLTTVKDTVGSSNLIIDYLAMPSRQFTLFAIQYEDILSVANCQIVLGLAIFVCVIDKVAAFFNLSGNKI